MGVTRRQREQNDMFEDIRHDLNRGEGTLNSGTLITTHPVQYNEQQSSEYPARRPKQYRIPYMPFIEVFGRVIPGCSATRQKDD